MTEGGVGPPGPDPTLGEDQPSSGTKLCVE